MTDSVFSEKYKIRSGDVDRNSKIKFCELVNYMQEAAWNSATSLGVSTYELLEKNITWVLNQQYFEVLRTPEHGEVIRIETWPVGMDRFFVYRDFKIFDESDNLILESFSRWVVIDIKLRKMIAVPESITNVEIPLDSDHEFFNFEKIKIGKGEKEVGFPIHVGWNDLDVNGHINNAQYFRWIFDAIDEHTLSNVSLKSINIIFKSEGKLREQLFSQIQRVSEYEFHHRIFNSGTQKDLIIAHVLFNKN